jgi:DNA replication and repair protein RecF
MTAPRAAPRSRARAGLVVLHARLRDFRSYARAELALADGGIVLVHGENGAGKTNFLEALHVATQGFSPRTRNDRELIRFGCESAQAAVAGRRDQVAVTSVVSLQAGRPKQVVLNTKPVSSPEQLRRQMAALVFTPDRLVVVKGGPAARRAYVDRALGRLVPARAQLPVEYGAAVGQRNAALRRISIGVSTREALGPWTEQVVSLGAELVDARREVIAALAEPFAERAGELGLPDARIGYDAEPPTIEALEARYDRELERGTTSLGPHLDDLSVLSGARDLRSFGSQGEQRLTVLALLLAEAELIAGRRGFAPLLLLDDVLSELDPDRRRVLAARVLEGGQTLITATQASSLPIRPAQLLEVSPGFVRAA